MTVVNCSWKTNKHGVNIMTESKNENVEGIGKVTTGNPVIRALFFLFAPFPLIHIYVFPNALSPKSPRCGRARLLLVSDVSSRTEIYTRRREAQYKVPRPNPPIRGPNPYPSLPAQGRLWATISLLHPS